jgi:heat shock 70kDa protein 1/2/6/8
MILSKMKLQAEDHYGGPISNCVIATPHCFTLAQKYATKDAGTIAGLDVLRIVSEPSAAITSFMLERQFEGKYWVDRYLLVFDLGGGSLDVSLFRVNRGTMEFKASFGDPNLGGEDFDNILFQYCKEDFETKTDADISNNFRAIRRLRAQCEKAKRILSSAQNAEIECDALADDEDYLMKISRTKFEELCEDLFKKCIKPIEDCLAEAKATKKEIYEVLLVGGSTRIPYI